MFGGFLSFIGFCLLSAAALQSFSSVPFAAGVYLQG
jgi:hypothetical protein